MCAQGTSNLTTGIQIWRCIRSLFLRHRNAHCPENNRHCRKMEQRELHQGNNLRSTAFNLGLPSWLGVRRPKGPSRALSLKLSEIQLKLWLGKRRRITCLEQGNAGSQPLLLPHFRRKVPSMRPPGRSAPARRFHHHRPCYHVRRPKPVWYYSNLTKRPNRSRPPRPRNLLRASQVQPLLQKGMEKTRKYANAFPYFSTH